MASCFASAVSVLINQLKETRAHYIRCIKPNDAKAPFVFNRPRVYDQLDVNGMFEVLKLMVASYPTRLAYTEIYDRYSGFLDEPTKRILATSDGPAGPSRMFTIETLRWLEQFAPTEFGVAEMSADDYKLGVTKVFFKLGKMEGLEALRDADESVKGEIAKQVGVMMRKARRRRQAIFLRAAGRLMRRCQQIKAHRPTSFGIDLSLVQTLSLPSCRMYIAAIRTLFDKH